VNYERIDSTGAVSWVPGEQRCRSGGLCGEHACC
jgi:hypothetical protein